MQRIMRRMPVLDRVYCLIHGPISHLPPGPRKLTVYLTFVPGGGGANVDPWRPLAFLEAAHVVRLPQAFFFSEKWPPFCSKPDTSVCVAAGACFSRKTLVPSFLAALDGSLRCRRRNCFFFLPESDPHISGGPEKFLRRRRRHFFSERWSLGFVGESQMELDLDISRL